MNPTGFPWTALMGMQLLLRSHRIAWFAYGWVEREHVLNVTALTEGWMRAFGLPAVQLDTPRRRIGSTVPPVAPRVPDHDGDRAETARHRSPRHAGPRS